LNETLQDSFRAWFPRIQACRYEKGERVAAGQSETKVVYPHSVHTGGGGFFVTSLYTLEEMRAVKIKE
jgi:hypothetical protein